MMELRGVVVFVSLISIVYLSIMAFPLKFFSLHFKSLLSLFTFHIVYFFYIVYSSVVSLSREGCGGKKGQKGEIERKRILNSAEY